MVVLLVIVCVLEAALLVGFGLYAEFLELKKRQGRQAAIGHGAMGSMKH